MQGSDLKRYITITQLDGSQKQLSGDSLPITIGNSPDADISIPEGDQVSAYVGDSQGHLFIQPSENRTVPFFHNNRILSESRWLKSNDTIQSGNIHIDYLKKGDILLFTVKEQALQEVSRHSLKPPSEPPPEDRSNGNGADSIPVNIENDTSFSNTKKAVIAFLCMIFLCLGLGVLFVILARPLAIDITPAPDSVSLKGFPPAIKLGDRFLCLPGTYSAEIAKQGYYPVTKETTIKADTENRLSLTLEKLPGILELDVIPEGGLTIYSGDTLVATTPPHRLELSPGPHTLKLVRDRYQPILAEITIDGQGKKQTLKAVLEPDWAEITITSAPPGADVIIDNETSGTTPLKIELLSGTHPLTLAKELYLEKQVNIEVTAGEDTTHDLQLELRPGVLKLVTTPPGTALTIDGVYRGTTPLTLGLSSRSDHEMVLTAPGYKPYKQELYLEPEEEQALEIVLEQERGVVYLTTHPPGATILINGRNYGAGQGKLTLPTTKQRFEISASGYKPETRTIVPKVGFSQQLTIELIPDVKSSKLLPSSQAPAMLETGSGQKLLRIAPTPFTMGAPRREPGRRANERQRTVIMKRPYYLSEKPVNNRDYRLYDNSHNSGAISGISLNDDSQPVVAVSWKDAVQYLNWLSSRDNLQPFYTADGDSFVAASPPANGYRLPTEAEWAFAARQVGSPVSQRFPWGNTFPPDKVIGNYGDIAAVNLLPRILQGYNDTFPVSSPVGSFPPNKGGFYDMGGNVGEWCHDFYSASTVTMSNQTDPMGPTSGTHRVIRGSSWRDAAITELRLSYRAYHRAARDNVGFRIARYQ